MSLRAMNVKWLAIGFAIFVVLVILFADLGYLQGALAALHEFPFGDKIGHFLLIGILCFLIISSLIQAYPSWNPKWIAFAAIFALAVVFTLEEASQGPIRGRHASLGDLSANYAGILYFGILALRVNKKRKP